MLDENILVQDIDADHWTRLLGLFDSGEGQTPSILFLIMDQGACIKAIHSTAGAIRGFDYGNGDMAKLAGDHNADYVATVSREFLQRVFAEGESQVYHGDDYVKQLMGIYNNVIDYTSENINWYPERYRELKPLDYDKIQKVFDRFIPNGKTLFFCVVENGHPYTSLILGKRSGNISLLTTLDAIDMANEPFDTGDDLERILSSIAEKFEQVHLAFIIEKRAFLELLAGTRPVTYLRAAIEHQRAFIHPMTWRLRFVLWAARVFKKL